MAKKMISRLSVLAVLIVFLAACSKTVEYTNIIPADATVVTSINLKSLASKAGLNDKENEAAKQKVLEALKSGMNAATFQQLEKVMNNPSESGIDVEAPVYVFTSPSFPYSTAVAKIKSEDDLHASLEIMVKEQICQPINEAAGYSFTTMNGGLVAFNNSTVMLISVKGTSQIEKAKEGITNLLKQTADNTLIIDAYNANPTSMQASISNFRNMEVENKMLILGDMRELGKDSPEEHQKIADFLTECGFKDVMLVGDQFAAAKHNFPTYPDAPAVIEVLQKSKPHGKTILIKGSNGIKLSTVIDYL